MWSNGYCVVCAGSYEAHVTDAVEEHESVREVKSAVQQPSFCTLEDCFQVYTRDERVTTLSFCRLSSTTCFVSIVFSQLLAFASGDYLWI